MATPRPEEGGRRPPDPGLCGRCHHARTTRSARGSLFYRCSRAEHDPRFVRYPPLPVLECIGFEAGDAGGAGLGGDAG